MALAKALRCAPKARPRRETDGGDVFADRRCVASIEGQRSADAEFPFGKRQLDGSSSYSRCEWIEFFWWLPLARRQAPPWEKGDGVVGLRAAQVATRSSVAQS